MEKFIVKPDITLYTGIRVKKDTKIEYKNENVEQIIDDLILRTKMIEKGANFESISNITINLKEEEILVFDEARGYILPGVQVQTIKEVIEDFECIKEI